MALRTLPQFLIHQARSHPHGVAMREKQRGIWQEWTWAQYLQEVQDLTLGLVALGFARGDKLAILSDNRPQVYWTMVAVQIAGGMPVPLYQDAISRELQYVIDHADARFGNDSSRLVADDAADHRGRCLRRERHGPEPDQGSDDS